MPEQVSVIPRPLELSYPPLPPGGGSRSKSRRMLCVVEVNAFNVESTFPSLCVSMSATKHVSNKVEPMHLQAQTVLTKENERKGGCTMAMQVWCRPFPMVGGVLPYSLSGYEPMGTPGSGAREGFFLLSIVFFVHARDRECG